MKRSRIHTAQSLRIAPYELKIRQTKYWSISMANGWTLERRARQSALIQQWKPWERSTGPKTAAGKTQVSRNAFKGGHREMLRALAALLREQEEHIRR